MDMHNKLSGNPTHYWIQSNEWTEAFKSTLSNNKKNEFDKEWKKLDDYLEEWTNAPPKKQTNMENPISWN